MAGLRKLKDAGFLEEDGEETPKPKAGGSGKKPRKPKAAAASDEDEPEPKKQPLKDVAAPEFEVSKLHNGQLEFATLVRCVVDPELAARLWPRLAEEHFAADTTMSIYRRLRTLHQLGKEWPGLKALAMDPAVDQAARAQLESAVAKAERGKDLLHKSIILANGHQVSLESASDFEGHVFDLLDSYRITRQGAEQMVGVIENIAEDEEFDPLMGPELVERAASEVLAIRGQESIADNLLHFGAGTMPADDDKRRRELKKLFMKDKPRFKTGIDAFDDKAGGFQGGEVVLLGANTGGGKCLTGEALMFTENGVVTMEEMAASIGAQEGYTPTETTVFGERGLEPATSFYRETVDKVFQVRTALGFESTATAAHRVRVLRHGHIEWEYQNKLRAGDAVLVPVGQELWGSKTSIEWIPEAGERGTRRDVVAPSKLTPELARVLGYLVSEGHFKPRKFSFTMYDPQVMEDFVRCWRASFPEEGVEFERDGVEARLPVAKNLGSFLNALGLSYGLSADRSIPLAIRQAPRPLVVEFLRALFEGDGYTQKDNKKQVFYTTTSPKLHRQLKVLLTNLGILTNTVVQTKTATNGTPGNSSTAYTLVIGHKFVDVFGEHIGFISDRKKAGLVDVQSRGERPSVGRKTEYLHGALPAAKAVWEEVRAQTKGDRGVPYALTNRVRVALGRGVVTKLTAATLVEMGSRYETSGPAMDTLRLVASDSLYVDLIEEVAQIDCQTEVYDLVVPGTNSFSANGLIQHNTAAQLTMMTNMARMGTSVAMLQLELSLEQMDERVSAHLGRVNSNIVRSGNIEPKIQTRIKDAWDEFHEECREAQGRFTIYAPSSSTIAGCEMVFKQYDYKVWFIDYVNLLNLDGDDAKLQGWEKLSRITKQFKALAKKYNICIVLGVQVNIDSDGNVEIRYAKAMKEDADIVLTWHMTQEAKDEGVVWWKHLKARQYEPFDFPVKIALEYYAFENFREESRKRKRTLGKRKVHPKDEVDQAIEGGFRKKEKPLVVEDERPMLDAILAGDLEAALKSDTALEVDDDDEYVDFDEE